MTSVWQQADVLVELAEEFAWCVAPCQTTSLAKCPCTIVCDQSRFSFTPTAAASAADHRCWQNAWSNGQALHEIAKHRSLTNLLCKVQVMMPLLRPGTDATLLQNTEDNLHAFSVKGLRTLVVGSKVRPQLRGTLQRMGDGFPPWRFTQRAW
jgi:hypothetical protein